MNDVSVKKDFVISQDPAPKAELDKQTPVNLLISKGAPSLVIQMPDLVNGTVEEAQVILKGLGLQMPQVSEEVARPDMNNGLIVSQTPAVGTVMNSGDPIAVTVVNNLGTEQPDQNSTTTEGSTESAVPPVENVREPEEQSAPPESEVPSLDDLPSERPDPQDQPEAPDQTIPEE